jgi:hypothetical protein
MTAAAAQVLKQGFQSFELEKFSIPISKRLALNVYSSTKPHNLKIVNLQKRLVLTCEGKERVGEGAGFGFPVLFESFEELSSLVFAKTMVP